MNLALVIERVGVLRVGKRVLRAGRAGSRNLFFRGNALREQRALSIAKR
jgi:hypothetical protein